MPALPPPRGRGFAPEEIEELPDDAILEQDLKSAPVHEEIVELGDDAIVGEVRGAHLPQPRTTVLQEYSSVVIADEARAVSGARRLVSDQTVVVRDRRQLMPDPRLVARRSQQDRRRERVLFVSASVLAAVLGTGLMLWLSGKWEGEEPSATGDPGSGSTVSPSPSQSAHSPGNQPASEESADLPRLSIDELPIARDPQ